MKNFCLLFLMSLIILIEARTPIRSGPDALVASSSQELALDLSVARKVEKGKNFVISPVSIASMMGFLMLATRGNTHFELKRALHLQESISDNMIHESFGSIIGGLNATTLKQGGVDVNIASKLFLQEDFPIQQHFQREAEKYYGSNAQSLNFAGAPQQARRTINKWVNDNTNGHIPELLTFPINKATPFIAVNALYFKGEWEIPFNPDLTNSVPFYADGGRVRVQMMTNVINIPYYKDANRGLDIIALPYAGRRFAMFIILPHGDQGSTSLNSVEFFLTANDLDSLIRSMKQQKVSVHIPRMEVSGKLYLKEDLKNLGVQDLFEQRSADFWRLTPSEGVFVGDVVHQAMLRIDEKGTVGAAATATSADRVGGNPVFILNKPALIFIRDVSNGVTLFYAKVIKPQIIS